LATGVSRCGSENL